MGEVSHPTIADEFTELTSDVAGGGVISRPIREPSDRRRRGEFEDPSDRRRCGEFEDPPDRQRRRKIPKIRLSMERSGRWRK